MPLAVWVLPDVPPLLSMTVSVPVSVPLVPGVNVTVIEHVLVAARDVARNSVES